MELDREVYTTGQIAKICHVAPRTVSKWVDSGQLRGYRIPGSHDRRVRRKDLIRFMTTNGMISPDEATTCGAFGLSNEAILAICEQKLKVFRSALEIPIYEWLTEIYLGPNEGTDVARQIAIYCASRHIKTTWVIADDGYKPDWVSNFITLDQLRQIDLATIAKA